MTVVGTALMGSPEAYITLKPEAIDADNNVVDESLAAFLTTYLDSFATWIGRFPKAA